MKRLIKINLLVMIIIILTGCVKANVNIEISEDLDLAVKAEVLMQKSMLTLYGLNEDTYIKSITEQIPEDAQIEEITKTIDGEEWVGIQASYDELSGVDKSDILKKEDNNITLTLPTNELISSDYDLSQSGIYGVTLEQMQALGVEMNLVIKMPGQAESNYGKVDGDTVTIDLLELMDDNQVEEYIIISCDTSKQAIGDWWIYLALAGVIVVGIIIIVVIFKKKKNTIHSKEITGYCGNCGQPLHGERICPNCKQYVK